MVSSMRSATVGAFFFAILHCAGIVVAGVKDTAAFDCGGTTFDLDAISAGRYRVPAGGQSGTMERLSLSEPEEPLVITANWAEARKKFRYPIRLSFRYRLRADRLGPDERIFAKVKFFSLGKDGGREKGQPDWAMKIYDTGGGWRECSLNGLRVRDNVDEVDFIFSICGGLGKVEVKDFALSQGDTDPAADPKYPICVRNATMSLLDGCFAIGSGQPQLVAFEWKDNGEHKFDRGKWKMQLDLPKGFRCLAVPAALKGTDRIRTNEDGSQTVTFRPASHFVPGRKWNCWYQMVFPVVNDLPPGAEAGTGVFSAFYDGKIAALPAKVKFLSVDPVKADCVPKRYFNGIESQTDIFTFRDDAATDAVAKFMCEAGVRSCSAGEQPFRDALAKYGARHFALTTGWIGNGYKINAFPPCSKERPAEQRFVAYDKSYNPALVSNSACPISVYREESFFAEKVIPYLERDLSGRTGLLCNWEPDPYFYKGCACGRCCEEFAKFIGKPLADVKSDWPKCVLPGGRFADRIAKFRAVEHAKLVRVLHRHACRISGGEKSQGFIPEIVWSELADARLYNPLQIEVDPWEYVRDLRWVCPWGPYVWWDASKPYFYEKRLPLASFAAAKNVRERVNRECEPGKRPKLLALPSGMQGSNWVSTPEWIALAMDSFFFNGWEGLSVYYFPRGYDARYWKAYAAATSRAGRCEDYVIDGARTDGLSVAETVEEYAANCREATGFLPQCTDLGTLQTVSYDLKGGRIVAALNFWEKGAAFFTLKLRGLAKGDYTVVSEGKTLWAKDAKNVSWSSDELEKGIFLAAGAMRTVDFEIRPAAECADRRAKNVLTADVVQELYRKARPALAREADKDKKAEAMRGLTYPDTLPEI